MSDFSFSSSLFKNLVLQTRENQGLFGKGLRNLQGKKASVMTPNNYICANMLISVASLLCVSYTLTHSHTMTPFEALLKTLWEKEKLLVTSNFSFTHSVFYQFLLFTSNSKLSSADCFNLDQSKILLSGNGLSTQVIQTTYKAIQTTYRVRKLQGRHKQMYL